MSCADTYSDVSDSRETEILGSDSDVPTTSSCKQLLSCPLVDISEGKQAQKRKKVVNCITLMIKQVMCGVMLEKNQRKKTLPWNHRFENSNNSESVVEVVSSITGDDTTKLFTE